MGASGNTRAARSTRPLPGSSSAQPLDASNLLYLTLCVYSSDDIAFPSATTQPKLLFVSLLEKAVAVHERVFNVTKSHLTANFPTHHIDFLILVCVTLWCHAETTLSAVVVSVGRFACPAPAPVAFTAHGFAFAFHLENRWLDKQAYHQTLALTHRSGFTMRQPRSRTPA